MRNRTIIIAIFVLVVFRSAMADNWQFKKELKSDDFIFGETTITRIIDTRENQSKPEYKIKVAVKGKDVALFKGLTFSGISAFGSGTYILGVSNSGLSSFAYFILDSSGNLLRAENHSNKFLYCKTSVTLVREWVDDENMDIVESYKTIQNESSPENPYVHLESVAIKGCDNNKVIIWSQ